MKWSHPLHMLCEYVEQKHIQATPETQSSNTIEYKLTKQYFHTKKIKMNPKYNGVYTASSNFIKDVEVDKPCNYLEATIMHDAEKCISHGVRNRLHLQNIWDFVHLPSDKKSLFHANEFIVTDM